MARSKKSGIAGSGRNNTPLPYTEQQRKTHEFASMRRTVKTGATTEKLTNYQIMERKQFESGLSGNSVSQRDYLRRVELAEEARREDVQARCLMWGHIKAKSQQAIDQARASGAPIPRVLPHPDDVIIDWESGPRFLGPIDEDEWKLFKQTLDLRDLLYLQQAMEDALDHVPTRNRPSQGGALVLAMFLNQMMAPSLRLSESEEFWRVYELRALPKRQLLLDCRKAWRRFGATAARGQRFGTAETIFPMLRALMGAIKAHKVIEDDPLGFEEAIQTATTATGAFINSALARQRKDGMSGSNKQEKPS
jgi:hypothetical protein